ncbi:MAG: hypothetical protein ACE5HI_01800 [bacterium]
MRIVSTYLIIYLTFSLFMCAGNRSKSNFGEYSTDVGLATEFDAVDKTRRLLDRHHYELFREENDASGIYFETRWKERKPFDDERIMGIVSGRSRLIIRGQPKTRFGSGMAVSYRIKFFAESEVLSPTTGKWTREPMSDMLKNYLKMIADEFKTEFKTGGLRRY